MSRAFPLLDRFALGKCVTCVSQASDMHNLEQAPEEAVMTAAMHPGAYMEPNRKAILCLCYDTNMLEVRRLILERFGYKVFPSSSVEHAKNIAEYECPDMLLIDNSHPEIDFEQIALQVKQVCPEVIAVVLSPYYYVARHGASGVIDRFVPKDDGPSALISQIEELFGARGPESAASRSM